MKDIIKKQLKDIINTLRIDAIKSERENQKEFARLGINKKAKEVIADKQYWSGYLDALNNLESEIKKLK